MGTSASTSAKSIPALLGAFFDKNDLAIIAARYPTSSELLLGEATSIAIEAHEFALDSPLTPDGLRREINQSRKEFLAFLEHVLKASVERALPDVLLDASPTLNVKTDFSAWVCFCVTLAALIVVWWQKLAASKEFVFIAQNFGTNSWAKRLLRSGPNAAERTHWTLVAAWQSARLSPQECEAAVAALGKAPGGEILTFDLGNSIDASIMECVGKPHAYVANTISSGFKWQDSVLVKARVETVTADYVTLRRLPDSRLTRWLLENLGVHAKDPGVRLERGILYPLLFKSGDAHECDRWLRELCASSPEGTLIPFVPTLNQSLDEQTMESEVRSMAPQHEIVAEIRHCGIRRKEGEMVLRAVVRTKMSEEGHSLF